MFIVRTTEDDIVEVVCEICGEQVTDKLEPPFDQLKAFSWKWANIGPAIMQHHRFKHSSKAFEICANCDAPILETHWRDGGYCEAGYWVCEKC